MNRHSRKTIDRRALLASAAALVFAAGCSNVIGPPDAPQLYRLEPAKEDLHAGPKVAWALAVMTPEAPDALDSDRIAISRSAGTMDVYANCAWPDRLPALVQTGLVEQFENSGQIVQVASDDAGLRADYLLRTRIRNFEAQYDQPDGPPTAVVQIEAKLVSRTTREIIASLDVRKEAPASANTIPAAVAALNQAYTEALSQIVNWTLAAPAQSEQQMQQTVPPPQTHHFHHRRHRR